MRLAGIEKGGYYPYPPHMAEVTASWFTPLPAGICGRLFDPCAGEGEIASLLGKLLNCETWGCELFPYRAEKAASRMNKCHNAARESCSLTDESVTLLWCDPPDDTVLLECLERSQHFRLLGDLGDFFQVDFGEEVFIVVVGGHEGSWSVCLLFHSDG